MGRNRRYPTQAEKQRAYRERDNAMRSATERLWQSLFWAHCAGDQLARDCMVACSSGVQAVAWLADHFQEVGGQTKARLIPERVIESVLGKLDQKSAIESVLAEVARRQGKSG